MSLVVKVFLVGANGKMRVLDVPDGCGDSAGFESWRTDVWGSDAVRSLGAAVLPLLSEGDLYVPPYGVDTFLSECLMLRENLERIVQGTQPVRTVEEHRSAIEQRLSNLTDAARRAREVGGGVLVW
ncbi:hypothetical protein ABZ135_10505 [Streptomyces sp. NPDC006339]|uniref:hypothetical protein n=1 Tax=Streptomyces sp. NPDC006339 TaxID=3156755 RepID=UPI0033AE6D6E